MNTPYIAGKTLLIVIDGQVDFTDRDGSALPVPGGVLALRRTADYIIQNAADIDAILATQDRHVPNHIAHPVRWVDATGVAPEPYTPIALSQIDAGEYRAADPNQQDQQRKYVAELEARGGKTLMIWPPHCIEGTYGYEIDAALKSAYLYWEEITGNQVVYLDKGMHPDTEQYGAFAADVPIPGAPETFLNQKLVDWITGFDTIIWTGLALTHCLSASFEQVMESVPLRDYGCHILLTDCTASVPGFEDYGQTWLETWKAQGIKVGNTQSMQLV